MICTRLSELWSSVRARIAAVPAKRGRVTARFRPSVPIPARRTDAP